MSEQNGNKDGRGHGTDPGSRNSNLVADLIEGAIAGAAATWVMGKVTSYLYEHEDKTVRHEEDSARGGKTAYGVAAEKVAELAGTSLSDDERKTEGERIHWRSASVQAHYTAFSATASHKQVLLAAWALEPRSGS